MRRALDVYEAPDEYGSAGDVLYSADIGMLRSRPCAAMCACQTSDSCAIDKELCDRRVHRGQSWSNKLCLAGLCPCESSH